MVSALTKDSETLVSVSGLVDRAVQDAQRKSVTSFQLKDFDESPHIQKNYVTSEVRAKRWLKAYGVD
ncbi:hypothetical protein GCM10022627_35180 [Haloarcula argentinensis]|uniref:Uncharacterized protein n=1 Tax=Haloarcula argentinensis TaxID=43776 RepID=A0A830FWU6_HALAR|nr:hypothetical protein GCM10009006_33670 [Haloarcula argentinensis]